MGTGPLLIVYSVAILVASLAGGWVPMLVRVTHRRLEIALSFVSGVMLGVALMHLLPHALMERAAAVAATAEEHAGDEHGHPATDWGTHGHDLLDPVILWLLAGFLAMFFLERSFPFHHHDAPHDEAPADEPGAGGHHHHPLTWIGATVGLLVHSLVAGMALAASVESAAHAQAAPALAGLGTFLMIVLHKPFDALTIGTLMAAGDSPRRLRHLVNGLFSLAIPIGAGLFMLGAIGAGGAPHGLVSAALAFSAGTFLCIALSDLLPELQFHRHDRFSLSLALVLGLGLAWSVGLLE